MSRPEALTDSFVLGLLIGAALFLLVWAGAATFVSWTRRYDAPKRRRWLR